MQSKACGRSFAEKSAVNSHFLTIRVDCANLVEFPERCRLRKTATGINGGSGQGEDSVRGEREWRWIAGEQSSQRGQWMGKNNSSALISQQQGGLSHCPKTADPRAKPD